MTRRLAGDEGDQALAADLYGGARAETPRLRHDVKEKKRKRRKSNQNKKEAANRRRLLVLQKVYLKKP
jgi:hypothetical protein